MLYSSANSSFLLFYFDVTLNIETTYQPADVTLETDIQKAVLQFRQTCIVKILLSKVK